MQAFQIKSKNKKKKKKIKNVINKTAVAEVNNYDMENAEDEGENANIQEGMIPIY